MNKLMYRFVATTKKKKKRNRPVFRHGMPPQGIPRKKLLFIHDTMLNMGSRENMRGVFSVKAYTCNDGRLAN